MASLASSTSAYRHGHTPFLRPRRARRLMEQCSGGFLQADLFPSCMGGCHSPAPLAERGRQPPRLPRAPCPLGVPRSRSPLSNCNNKYSRSIKTTESAWLFALDARNGPGRLAASRVMDNPQHLPAQPAVNQSPAGVPPPRAAAAPPPPPEETPARWQMSQLP